MRIAAISLRFLLLGGWCAALPTPALAADDAGAGASLPGARLDFRASGAMRDDLVSRNGQQIGTGGSALSGLSLAGAWLGPSFPVGFAAHLHLERFGVRAEDTSNGALDTAATALDGGLAVLGRLPGSNLSRGLEGQLGYGFVRMPVAAVHGEPNALFASPLSVQMLALTTHGPQLGARGWWRAGGTVTLEADLRALPVGLGARYADHPLRLWQASAGAGLLVGRFEAAGVRWAGRLGYELAASGAEGDDGRVEISQRRHVVGIGLRAGFLLPAPAVTVRVPDPPPPAAQPLQTIRGVVRRAGLPSEGGGLPIADVEIAVVNGPSTRTDAAGKFVLENVAPGLAQLRLLHRNFVTGEEVVSVGSETEVHVEALLRPTAANRIATISGVVRSETGDSLPARVRVLERDQDTSADSGGRFLLDLPPGRYTLVIEAPGYGRQERSFEIVAGEQRIYNVDLKASR
ncbi:MAG TPA: carboxypeptidase-like regulatory domain-containing protein [Polyangia bacterium]